MRRIFITGTDTNVGKTLVSSWLCLHTHAHYFKPIQTGSIEGTDSKTVKHLSHHTIIHQETYCFEAPLSPHLAAPLEGAMINMDDIALPPVQNLIVEGAGGLLVPINHRDLMIDLIKKFTIPVILVAGTHLGTINHTLLSLEALKIRHIELLGIITTGQINTPVCDTISELGAIPLLAHIPWLESVNTKTLSEIPLTVPLKTFFGV